MGMSFVSCNDMCKRDDDSREIGPKNAKERHANVLRTSTKRIKDFNKDKDDVNVISKRALEKMDRFT